MLLSIENVKQVRKWMCKRTGNKYTKDSDDFSKNMPPHMADTLLNE